MLWPLRRVTGSKARLSFSHWTLFPTLNCGSWCRRVSIYRSFFLSPSKENLWKGILCFCCYAWNSKSDAVLTSSSRAVSRCTGTDMICLAWMSSEVLYTLSRQTSWTKVLLSWTEKTDSLRLLFNAIVCSWSWVRNSMNTAVLVRIWFTCFHWRSWLLSHIRDCIIFYTPPPSPEGTPGMSNVSPLSGISELPFDSTLLFPILFFCLLL